MKDFEALKAELNRRCPGLEIRTGEAMSRHTTFRIGGPAALMALPRTKEEAGAALAAAHELGESPVIIGNGSDLLVSDRGLDRFVIKIGPDFDRCRAEGTTIWADCGIALSRLSCLARDWGLAGLEFAQGIPGSLGGALIMNAGAYGGEMSQVVSEIFCYDMCGAEHRVTEFGYGYRRSVFSDGGYLLTGARLELHRGDPAQIRSRMDELSARRQAKQPLEYPSAGSVFKRPAGHFAGALIEGCGLKGLTVGGAQVSEKHAGFIINRGGATCADVLELVRKVKERVLAETGVELEMEIRVLGET